MCRKCIARCGGGTTITQLPDVSSLLLFLEDGSTNFRMNPRVQGGPVRQVDRMSARVGP